MKKSIVLIFALALFFSCDKEKEEPVISKTDLLTGGSQKTWYMHSASPADELCSSQSDNTYIFFADGSFEYDHGTVTMGTDNDSECGDLVNLEGTWEFKENETAIVIVGRRVKGETEDMAEPLTLFDVKIDELAIGRLVLVDRNDPALSAEFRPK